MITYIYDGSFEGFLSVVFEAYRSGTFPEVIVKQSVYQPSLLGSVVHVDTQEEWAYRVIEGVEKRTSKGKGHALYKVCLSETLNWEMLLLGYIRAVISSSENIEENFANPYVLKVQQINKQMDREIHRMHAFVRFQKTLDGVYFATIAPDFNVIPLIGIHFEKRYADQHWCIYDIKRKIGIYYDQTKVWDMELEFPRFNPATGGLEDEVLDKGKDYEELWKNYFKAVNIKERRNIKLHQRHIPKRYWRFLTEKR